MILYEQVDAGNSGFLGLLNKVIADLVIVSQRGTIIEDKYRQMLSRGLYQPVPG